MNTFETKFSYGQRVCAIDRGYANRKANCVACSNSAKVSINGVEYNCPGCDGRGQSIASVTCWYVGKSGCLAVLVSEGSTVIGTLRICATKPTLNAPSGTPPPSSASRLCAGDHPRPTHST